MTDGWPVLPYEAWKATCDTLHGHTQVLGKLAVALASLGGFGQNDVPALSFLAWQKFSSIARCLDAALAGLAVVASQALHMQNRLPPEPLQALITQIRAAVPPVDSPRPLGAECQSLTDAFTAQALTGEAARQSRGS